MALVWAYLTAPMFMLLWLGLLVIIFLHYSTDPGKTLLQHANEPQPCQLRSPSHVFPLGVKVYRNMKVHVHAVVWLLILLSPCGIAEVWILHGSSLHQIHVTFQELYVSSRRHLKVIFKRILAHLSSTEPVYCIISVHREFTGPTGRWWSQRWNRNAETPGKLWLLLMETASVRF